MEDKAEIISALDTKKLSHLESIIKSEQKLRYMTMFLAIMVIFCSAAVVLQYRQGRVYRDQLIEISEDNNHIVKQIESCTLPTGECYKEGNENRIGYFGYLDSLCRRQDELALKNGLDSLSTPCPINPANIIEGGE